LFQRFTRQAGPTIRSASKSAFTPGRIIVGGGTVRRGKRKRVDYLLSYLRDRPLAVVEAKSEYRLPSDGLQQAKEYAELLDVRFAYSTNGPGIVEHDYTRAPIGSVFRHLSTLASVSIPLFKPFAPGIEQPLFLVSKMEGRAAEADGDEAQKGRQPPGEAPEEPAVETAQPRRAAIPVGHAWLLLD
jgi:type I site-specific restriction endonuclease